jgi:periplasmic divalent cation tolerance protein
MDADLPDILLVLTNLPDEASADAVSHAVLAARAAACVNRLAPCRSEYWWEGRIERATEWPLLIKTTRAQYQRLEDVIRRAHPYDIPEIVALPVTGGLPAYLGWVANEVADGMADNTGKHKA